MGTTQLMSVPYSLNAVSLTLTPPTGESFEVKADKYGLNEILQLNLLSITTNTEKGNDSGLELDPKELVNMIPEALVKHEDPDRNWSISYNQLIPVLIKAIQEQQSQIDDLKEQLSQVQQQ